MTAPSEALKNEVVEAVRERVRMADAWSKSTGYPAADYFDTMMDLRRMLHAYDARSPSPVPASPEVEEALRISDMAQGEHFKSDVWVKALGTLAAEVRRLRAEAGMARAVEDARDTCLFYGAGIPFAEKLRERMEAALAAHDAATKGEDR